MSEYEHILVDHEDGVAVLTLNRPESLNAMNRQLNDELRDAVIAACSDDDIGCIVVTGSGDRAFTAGGDIHEQRADDATMSEEELDRKRDIYMRGAYEISACPLPTIGMMNGLAYGGGAVLASSLDMRIGCEKTKFRFLAAAYGRINSTWTLPNQVGWPMAKELLFSARIVEAEEAYRIGLLNHLVPSAELRAKTMELAKTIAGNHRGAVSGVKELLMRDLGQPLQTQWENEVDYGQNVLKGAKAEDAFPDFIARKGRPLPS
ncbi:MAG: enoyl-CoA hydratase/isomerase family protein [Rickettsiales bacterium]|jgi:enoyl-CoA hydratase/carnithine racemase